jgi:hypothetical protein
MFKCAPYQKLPATDFNMLKGRKGGRTKLSHINYPNHKHTIQSSLSYQKYGEVLQCKPKSATMQSSPIHIAINYTAYNRSSRRQLYTTSPYEISLHIS